MERLILQYQDLSTYLYPEETALALSEQIPVYTKLLKEVVARAKPFVAFSEVGAKP